MNVILVVAVAFGILFLLPIVAMTGFAVGELLQTKIKRMFW